MFVQDHWIHENKNAAVQKNGHLVYIKVRPYIAHGEAITNTNQTKNNTLYILLTLFPSWPIDCATGYRFTKGLTQNLKLTHTFKAW